MFLVVLLSLFVGAPSSAQTARVVKVEAEVTYNVHIPQGQVSIRGDHESQTLTPFVKVSRDGKDLESASQVSAEKRGSLVTIRALPAAAPTNKWEFRFPPGHKVRVYMDQGPVTVSAFQSEFVLNSAQGAVTLSGLKGHAKIHVGKGSVTVIDSSGTLDIETATAAVALKKFAGPYKVLTLTGDVLVENSDGAGDVKVAAGSTKVIGGAGGINFDLNRGNLNVQNFKGQVEGDLHEANTSIVMEAGTQIQFALGSGKIAVNAKKASGAQIDLLSSEGGDFVVPNHLNVQKEGLHRVVRGSLKGEKSDSRISVRSKEGSVSVIQ